MEHPTDPLRATAAVARALEFAPEDLAATVWTRGSISLEYYAPRGTDVQRPHDRDELYFIVKGTGTFVCGERTTPFGPNDALFAAAGAVHRFEDFSDDFETWVLFYGPRGGEG